ncbi:carbohydrate ABC transporter permease [Streptomyces sp. 5-10]|uniref:carbohydrate ABC transporter permease n=1 Tax=Streptomyces sp. 5-10 TaxID=878925 RepID=UPI001CC2C6D7|nr:carbohydrate ABC transporter permease [Streptomyces sp. 5-10]
MATLLARSAPANVPLRARVMAPVRRAAFGLLIAGIVVWSLFPFLWQAVSSFQPDRELSGDTPKFLPFPGGTLEHYQNVFVAKNFGPYIVNSAIVDLASTAIALALATLAAFAIARLPLPGKGAVMSLVLAVSMFPQISIVTPLYQLLNRLGLLDTYSGLSGVYIGLALPLMVYILWGHFRAIPAEVDEAAKIDGAGPLRTLWSVIIPVSLPGVVPAALLGFIAAWNELLLALSFTTSPDHQTIPVGIANFTALYNVPWGDMAAASVVVTIPLVILVLVFQKRIVEGVTAGAVKG